MLDRLREGVKSTWAKIILGLIIASFIFAGVGSSILNSGVNTVALVNGEEITRQQFDTSYQQDRARLGERFSQIYNTDAKLKQFQQAVLDRMISQRLTKQANDELGIFVGRSVIKEQIVNTPQFQIDGKFNEDLFRSLLAQNGWTPTRYEEQLRQDMENRQLSAIMDSEFALDSEVDNQLVLQGQTRTGRYLNIDSSLLQASIGFEGEAGEKQLQDYYQSNINRYQLPEMLTVEYIELVAANLTPELLDEEISSYYDEHLADYLNEEERKASHILITVSSDADQATVADAQAKMDAIVARLNQGEDFSTVAKENSDDTVSAEEGGDLGFFGINIMDPAFEEAAFALEKIDDVSKVVRSSFGFHLIKLTAIKASQQKSLEDVKGNISVTLKSIKSEEMFVELNAIITDKAFEFTDSLEEVAQASGLEVKVSQPFVEAGGKDLFANPAIVEAAFSDQVRVDGYNSDVISISENHSVVLRIKQQTPSRTMAFEEVKAQLEENLRREKSQIKAVEFGESVARAIKQGQSLTQALEILPEFLKASWVEFSDVGRNDAILTAQVRNQLFKMPLPVQTESGSSAAVNQGFATFSGFTVIQLDKITSGDAVKSTIEQKKQIQLQLSKEWSYAEYKALQEWLMSNAEIEKFLVQDNIQNQ